MPKLTSADFESALRDTFSPALRAIIDEYDFTYTPATKEEYDQWMQKINETLSAEWIVRAGEHRIDQWESGWGENLKALEETKNVSALIPRYFGKYNVVRWKQSFITPQSKDFEYHTLAAIEDWIFSKYLAGAKTIYEFGCGTGHNLLRARRANPTAKLYGLDWATSSQEIIKKMGELGLLTNAEGKRFDFFNPDASFPLEPGAAIYTIAALEQIGDKFQPFVDYLLAQKPSVCIHLEPIAELLDPSNLFDKLSIAYFEKRNYLKGFLAHLRELEKQGRVTIHQAQRTYIGSLFIEGYSVVVWSPR